MSGVAVTDNNFYGHVTTDKPTFLTPVGYVLVKNNLGWISENFGATVVADGGSISHGLSFAPNTVRVTPSVSGQMASVTAIGTYVFVVAIKTHTGAPGTSQTIYWEAEIR
jgi:hypothetical protein